MSKFLEKELERSGWNLGVRFLEIQTPLAKIFRRSSPAVLPRGGGTVAAPKSRDYEKGVSYLVT